MIRVFPILSTLSLRATELQLQCASLRLLFVLLSCMPGRAGKHVNKTTELLVRCVLCAPEGSAHRQELLRFALPVAKLVASAAPESVTAFVDGCRDSPGVLAVVTALELR